VREILHGQMLALKRQFMRPVLVVVGLDFIFMIAGAHRVGSAADTLWLWLCWAGIVTLIADLYTLCWVGMWIGLVARRPNRATGATVARVLLLPWGAWAGLLMVTSLSRVWHRVEDTWVFYLGLWFALGMMADIYFCLWARSRLRRDLRTVATQRFVPGRPFFAWLKSPRGPPSPALPTAFASET